MIAVCPTCGVMFVTTQEDACSPEHYCRDCYLRLIDWDRRTTKHLDPEPERPEQETMND